MKLSPYLKVIKEELGNDVFLFNPRSGSWLSMLPSAYKYLLDLVEKGEDPYTLGNQYGFQENEIAEFLKHLFVHRILISDDVVQSNGESFRINSCYFHVTQRCNFQCRTCYSWRDGRNQLVNEVNIEAIDKILRQLADFGLKTLVISGGEPFIRNDLPEILRIAKRNYSINRVVVISNGSIITEEKAKQTIPYVDEFCISLDGPSENINSEIRGKGNFDKAINGIKTLKELDAKKINIIATVTHTNMPYLDDFLVLAQNLEVTLSFSMFVGTGAGLKSENGSLALSNDDFITLGKFLTRQGINLGENYIYGETSQSNGKNSPKRIPLSSKDCCGAGQTTLSIDYDGSLYPCHMLMKPEFRIGKLPNDSLNDLLARSTVGNLFRELSVEKIDKCFGCRLRYFCGGGCRANSYTTYKDLYSTDPACPLYETSINTILRAMSAGK